MSNFKNFSFSSFLISLDTPTQTSICHSLSYQQVNKSKQASKQKIKHIFSFSLLLSLHKQIHLKETLQHVGARVHFTFTGRHLHVYFTIILIF